MLKQATRAITNRTIYGVSACFLAILLAGHFSGLKAVSIVALVALCLAALWVVVKEGEEKLAIIIIGMGMLLPSFKLVTGLPHLRPEELLLIFFFGYLLLRDRKLQWRGTAELGTILAALIAATGISMLFAMLFLDARFSFRDVFELLKPVKYYLIILFIANINFTELKLQQLMKYFWIISGLFLMAGFLEYLNPGDIKELMGVYAPEKVVHSRLASQRLMGLLGNPNYTGILLMTILTMAFSFLVFQKQQLKATILYLTVFNLAGILLFLTMSRTALLAALLALAYLCLRAITTRSISKKQVISIMGAILLVMLVFLGSYGDKFLWRFEAGLDLAGSTSFQARLGFWEDAFTLIKQSPVLGWGPAKAEMTTQVDNEYLLITRRYGIVGLLIYLGLYSNILIRSGKLAARGRSSAEQAYGYGIQAITGGFLIFNITAGTFYNLQLMAVYFALVGVLLALERSGSNAGGTDDSDGKNTKQAETDTVTKKEAVKPLLVILSHRFPTVADPVKGIYVQEQIEAISSLGVAKIKIISPVPYAPRLLWFNKKWQAYGKVEKAGDFRGCQVYYPRYLVIPGASCFFLQGIAMFFSAFNLVRKMNRDYPTILLHAHTIMPDGLAALLLKLSFNKIKTIICTIHGSDILIFPFRNKITTQLTKLALSKMDHVVCVSEHLKQAVQSLCSREVEVITNGVNPELFTLDCHELEQVHIIKERWGGKKLVLFVGNLFETKGIKELLAAFGELDSNTVLLLVGYPSLQAYIEEFIQLHKLEERVVMIGTTPHREIKLWMMACDVFILPSYSEGMPVVMLEAMSLGKPVIISAVGGVPEIIRNGQNGILIPPKDVVAIRAALNSILENPVRAAQLGKAAQATVLENYTWHENANHMLRVYTECLADKASLRVVIKPRVLIMSSVHSWRDARIYYKELVSLAKHYTVELHAVGDDEENNQQENKKGQGGLKVVSQAVNLPETSGVTIYCLPKQQHRLTRIINTVKLIGRGLKSRPDILHFHDPELIPAALVIKLFTKCKVIYDVHEDFPAAILSKYWIPSVLRKPIACLANLIEKNSSRFFDLLIFAEASYQAKFRRLKTLKVDLYNYPVQFAEDILAENHASVLSDTRCTQGSTDKAEIELVYAGSLSKTRGALTMLQALDQVDFQDKSFRLWLLGPVRPAQLQEELQEYIANSRQLRGKVSFLGFVPLETVYRYCRSADLGLALLHPEPNYLHSLATKLYDYMSAGLPIVASNFPEWVNLVEETKSGLTVEPTSPQAIARVIEYLVHNPEIRVQMGINGREAVASRCNWAKEEQKLLAAYRQVLGEKAAQ